jgi:hypothetical protein
MLGAVSESFRTLEPGGRFVAVLEHPFTRPDRGSIANRAHASSSTRTGRSACSTARSSATGCGRTSAAGTDRFRPTRSRSPPRAWSSSSRRATRNRRAGRGCPSFSPYACESPWRNRRRRFPPRIASSRSPS